MTLDKEKARAVFAKLSLSETTRRFADCWLSAVSDGGALNEAAFFADAPEDIRARTITFEITPQALRIKHAGQQIVDTVGMPLVGEDYLLMAPPAQRATRLMRFSEIADGHVSVHQRWVVNTAGKMHVLNEIALPCGLSENGFPMTMSYVDADNPKSMGHIPAKKGVMNIAPVFETYPIHSAA
jgi:hypothetical protein